MCTNYYDHTYYYQQLIRSYRLRLFVVGGEHNIEMAMVVVGHICTQNIMITQHYLHI